MAELRTYTCAQDDLVIEFPNGETWLFFAPREPWGWWSGRVRINEAIKRHGRGLRRRALEGEVVREPRPAWVAAEARAMRAALTRPRNNGSPAGCNPSSSHLAAQGG